MRAYGIVELDRVTAKCSSPTCKHPHAAAGSIPMIARAECHPKKGTWISYYKGFVLVRCGKCEGLVCVIAAAVDGAEVPEAVVETVLRS